MQAEIISDGRTVWVNGENGMCLARFNQFGIDVHTDFDGQIKTGISCLACTHEKPGLTEWRSFQVLTRRFHGISIEDEHMPSFVRQEFMRCL